MGDAYIVAGFLPPETDPDAATAMGDVCRGILQVLAPHTCPILHEPSRRFPTLGESNRRRKAESQRIYEVAGILQIPAPRARARSRTHARTHKVESEGGRGRAKASEGFGRVAGGREGDDAGRRAPGGARYGGGVRERERERWEVEGLRKGT